MRPKITITPPGWLERLRLDSREWRYGEKRPVSLAKSLAIRIFTPWKLKRRKGHGPH